MRTGRPKRPLTIAEEQLERLESLAHRARSQSALARRHANPDAKAKVLERSELE
jgi:hypothetical protein